MRTRPFSPEAQSYLQSQLASRRFNLHDSIITLQGREFDVHEPWAKKAQQGFEDVWEVGMDLVDARSSDYFAVKVFVFWEYFGDGGLTPPEELLFGVARARIYEHFSAFAPREGMGTRYGIELRCPDWDDEFGLP